VHYYQHNIKDFNNSTRHLTRVERCLYRDAIELYYDTEEPLSGNLNRLQRKLLCTTDEEKTALSYILNEFFYLVDDVYCHTRCDFEINKFQSNSTAKSRAGKASADAKKEKREAKAKQKSTGVEHVLNSVEPVIEHNSTNQEPLTINHKPITIKEKKHSQSEIDIDDIFKFWKLTLNKTETAKLTKERKKKILDRLNENYTVEEIKRAITGCTQSAYHMGKNENGKIYDSLELILRSGENLEKFIGYNTTILQVNNNATNQSNANGKQTNGIRRTRTPTTTARIWDNQES